VSAQYSIPFCTALALVAGRDAVSIIDETFLSDEAVVALAGKVTLAHDPALEAAFPAKTGAGVRIICGNREIERSSEHCSGDWQLGDCSGLVASKFLDLTSRSMSAQQQSAMIEAIENLPRFAPAELRRLLSAQQQ